MNTKAIDGDAGLVEGDLLRDLLKARDILDAQPVPLRDRVYVPCAPHPTRARVCPDAPVVPFLNGVPRWVIWLGVFGTAALVAVFLGYFGWHVAKWAGVVR